MKDYNLFYNNKFYSKKTKKQQLFQKNTAVNVKTMFRVVIELLSP